MIFKTCNDFNSFPMLNKLDLGYQNRRNLRSRLKNLLLESILKTIFYFLLSFSHNDMIIYKEILIDGLMQWLVPSTAYSLINPAEFILTAA